MKLKSILTTLVLLLMLAGISGCSQELRMSTPKPAPMSQAASNSSSNKEAQQVLAKAESTATLNVPADRKIIRTGQFNLEIDSPVEAQRKIIAMTESLGGFVVSSESKLKDSESADQRIINIVVRVPSTQFDAAVDRVRSLGGRLINDDTKGQDVTEEYVDLEARIRAKKALEAQFLEIMKQAHKVSDALEVQQNLGNVRTEIEQLEGRRRFLENQASLSTLNITLQPPAPIITSSKTSFLASIKQTFGDSIDLASEIVLGLIRLVIILAPIVVLIGIPAFIIWRILRKRFRLIKSPETPSQV